MASQQLLLGTGAAKKIGVEDVVASHTWIGDGATTRTINNGVDLAGKGGLTIIKASNLTQPWFFTDTVRGATKTLRFNTSSGQATDTAALKSFTSSGFTVGNDAATNTSGGTIKYCSQSFAIKEGFFDIQEWSGNGTAGRTISHNLGAVPRCIMVKCITHGHDWVIFHGQLGSGKYFTNGDANWVSDSSHWNNTWPTSSVFTVGSTSNTNESGKDYVAYIFPLSSTAEYGENEDQSIFSTSDVTPHHINSVTKDIGFEPGIVILKKVQDNNNNAGNWYLYDRMRTVSSTGDDSVLEMNLASSEATSANYFEFTSNGFTIKPSHPGISSSGQTWLYWAWAAPTGKVMKTVETASNVFAMDTGNNVNGTMSNFDSGFAVDFALMRKHTSASDWYMGTRLSGTKYSKTNSADAGADVAAFKWESNTGWNNVNYSSDWQSWMWKRHGGLDVVVHNFTSSTNYVQLKHNLGVVPEMIFNKSLSASGLNHVYHKDLNSGTDQGRGKYLKLETGDSEAANSPYEGYEDYTATTIKVRNQGGSWLADGYHSFILFASVDGICKVGSYDGSSSTQTITTGFQPKFLIIKRYDAGYAWFILDTTRGWGSGNDSQISFNNGDAAASHDFGAPTSTGFTLTVGDSYNQSGGKYIYYAHA